MRTFTLVLVISLLVPALAFAGSGSSGSQGGGTVDPGFCWGGGVIVQPPPGFCWGEGVVVGPPVYAEKPGDSPPAGVGPALAYEAGLTPALDAISQGSAPASASSGSSRPETAGAPRSQMYIPPAVSRWVAQHPVAAR